MSIFLVLLAGNIKSSDSVNKRLMIMINSGVYSLKNSLKMSFGSMEVIISWQR